MQGVQGRRWEEVRSSFPQSGVFLQPSPTRGGLESLAELNKDWLAALLLHLLLRLLLFLLLCNSLISSAHQGVKNKEWGGKTGSQRGRRDRGFLHLLLHLR